MVTAPDLDHDVPGKIPAAGGIQLKAVWCFNAQPFITMTAYSKNLSFFNFIYFKTARPF